MKVQNEHNLNIQNMMEIILLHILTIFNFSITHPGNYKQN
jgi:hypothetical protein